MITGSPGAISCMRRSQKSPSLPVLTPAEKFISSRTRSTGRLSRTERMLFGFEAVSTSSNSSSRSSSREVSTLLLSSTIRIVPACIRSFSGKVIRFPNTLQASVKIFDTFGLLFCTNHLFLARRPPSLHGPLSGCMGRSSCFSPGLKRIFLAASCLPTIVGKPADRCRQACSQLSAGLLTIVGKQLDAGNCHELSGTCFKLSFIRSFIR